MAPLRVLAIAVLSSLGLSHGMKLKLSADTNPDGPVTKAWGKVKDVLEEDGKKAMESWEHQARKMYRAEVATHNKKLAVREERRATRKQNKAERAEQSATRHDEKVKLVEERRAQQAARKEANEKATAVQ
mmetsp:Transcript_43191/g.116494  ORF Transcript_43191/g.116494 Transcript_43191/m.116494 type:complete len:130 (-) Transcript_43191:100-489(-)|eukprot:CAMPEP_0171178342 /NCGR_PEP_ID=MMETSP0790-20130122/12703_1 /TAXON_ID=2925 /ORGANISM="Alexandrium catenella, Strain OF101" /LENGTH=129 /DNA_ID=CAMNT_0011643263 /DNA_START=86 /DNA_END=475 /DNA_ORIENTATION=-